MVRSMPLCWQPANLLYFAFLPISTRDIAYNCTEIAYRSPCRSCRSQLTGYTPLALESQHLTALQQLIPECRTRDQYRFGRRLARLQSGEALDDVSDLVADIEASCRWVIKRRDRAVDISFPPSLPVIERKDDITKAIVEI